MAEFISGADLVSRGVEGTGAATILNNQPTLQNLARLGGRMDNLYKTQEMLKMKLAAAKQEKEKEPKQPTLSPITTGGVTGEYLGAIGNQFMQGIAAIKGAKYNQKVASNDIAGANQEAADAASALATLNPVVQNTDKAVKNKIAEDADYYQFTPQVVENIQAQFPAIKADELSKITDPNQKEEYIMGKYSQFLQVDPQAIIRKSTLYNPDSYNYNGVFSVINKNLADRKFKILRADGTGDASNVSELFNINKKKGTVSLDYNKAYQAIDQLPKAREQMEVLQTLAVEKKKAETVAFSTLPPEKQKAELKAAAEQAAKDYVKNVFRIGLTADQEKDFQATEEKAAREARGAARGAVEPAKVFNGVMTFNPAAGMQEYITNDGKTQITPTDYVISSKGTVWQDVPFTINPNSVMVPMGRFNAEDRKALGAEKYRAAGGGTNNLWKTHVGGTVKAATKVTGMPIFTSYVQDIKDPTGKKFFAPGQFVPNYMLEHEVDGKQWLEKDNYYLASGHVASPEVNTKVGTDSSGNPIYEKVATTENFYPDALSSTQIFEAIRRNIKGQTPQQKGDIFSTEQTTAPAQSSFQSSSTQQKGDIFSQQAAGKKPNKKQSPFWNNKKAKETGAIK